MCTACIKGYMLDSPTIQCIKLEPMVITAIIFIKQIDFTGFIGISNTMNLYYMSTATSMSNVLIVFESVVTVNMHSVIGLFN